MTIDERRKYLHKMQARYWKAKSKKEKIRLLNEMESVTEFHRKSVIRLINGKLARKPRRRQRGRTYGLEVPWLTKYHLVGATACRRVTNWITLNEPWEHAALGHLFHQSHRGLSQIPRTAVDGLERNPQCQLTRR